MRRLIIPVAAFKRREVDSYSQGCDPDTCVTKELGVPAPMDSIIDVMSELVGDKLTKDDIYTFDPDVYCDTKSPPGFRVVQNNTKNGNFRVEHDRMENRRGRKPSAEEMKDFESDKINLWHATFEIRFKIQVVDMDEVDLAEYLGVTNHG